MSDARERRRQRAEGQNKTDFAGTAKKYRVPIIIVIIWAVVIGVNIGQAQGVVPEFGQECPGHWHSTFDVYVEDQKVAFTNNPAYTLEGGQMGVKIHLHTGQEGIWHFEPQGGKECIDFEDAMRDVDMRLSGDSLELGDSEYHDSRGWGGIHTENETHQLHIYYQPWDGSWREVSASKLNGMQPGDGSKILVVYGNQTDAELEQLQSSGTTSLSAELQPGGANAVADKFIPMMMVTIFAILAIVVWYNFAKKTW